MIANSNLENEYATSDGVTPLIQPQLAMVDEVEERREKVMRKHERYTNWKNNRIRSKNDQFQKDYEEKLTITIENERKKAEKAEKERNKLKGKKKKRSVKKSNEPKEDSM